MTTGNDPALPADTNQPAPNATEAAVAAVAADGADKPADGALTFTSPQPTDVDDVELTAAKTAAQAENTAGPGDGKPDAVTGKDPAQPTAAAATDPTKPAPQGGAPVMIPKQRLDEVLVKQSEAERKAAYWQGVAEARAQQPGQPGAAPAQQQQPSPQERLAQIHTAQDALAAKFDNGEITMADYKKQERELDAQAAGLREDALAARMKPAAAAPAAQGNDELYLETLTADLETKHPWVAVADKAGSDADWLYMKNRAIENLTGRGIDPTQGAVGRYELRKEIAHLWDQLGPALVGEKAKAQGITLPGAAPQGDQQPQPKPMSLEAQARQAGLRKAAGAPPDLNAMNGHTGDINGQPSEARLETMSDEEIGALPVSARNKLLGISA